MKNKVLIILLSVLFFLPLTTGAQTSTFTYQGSLNAGAGPANGNYDLEFRLFDLISGGTQQGVALQRLNVPVVNGVFKVDLNFGDQFTGGPRFVEISVRPAGGGAFTPLAPRHWVTSSPYAVRSLHAANADGLSLACMNCITSSQIQSVSGNAVAGQIPVAGMPAGSGHYIQNTISQQSGDFNIDGNGTLGGTLSAAVVTAPSITATTQYNIGINRALALGTASVFAGRLAGISNTTGSGNTFVGDSAGRFNTTSSNSSFFGRDAGTVNTAGDNSFFGAFAGESNTTGTRNSFFGYTAGRENVTDNDNSFFGYSAGRLGNGSNNSFFGSQAGNSTNNSEDNSFFGSNAGSGNVFGSRNAFFGSRAGESSTTGWRNTFIGAFSGSTNTTGDSNTIIGSGADVSLPDLQFATAIGAGATVGSSNTIALGRAFGVDRVRISGKLYIGSFDVGGNEPICKNVVGWVAECSSSLRYKTNVQTYTAGLNLVRRLRPIVFDWIDGAPRDLGFAAEEVAEVEPLLTTRNAAGEIEGVKYKQITTVLVNAVREQQTEIEQLKEQIRLQREQIEMMKKLICGRNYQAEACREK